MPCDQSVLLDYLDGALDPGSAEQLEAHLLACGGCWRAVRCDRLGRDMIRAARDTAPPTLADRVQLAVSLSVHRSPPRRTWRVAALAAVTVLVIGVSMSVIPRDRAAEPRPHGCRHGVRRHARHRHAAHRRHVGRDHPDEHFKDSVDVVVG